MKGSAQKRIIILKALYAKDKLRLGEIQEEMLNGRKTMHSIPVIENICNIMVRRGVAEQNGDYYSLTKVGCDMCKNLCKNR